jgi:hypothetical protein
MTPEYWVRTTSYHNMAKMHKKNRPHAEDAKAGGSLVL